MTLALEAQLTATHEVAVTENTVWLQANRNFGNMVPDLSEDWEANRARAVRLLGNYAAATALTRMKPLGKSGFLDLDRTARADLHHTDGFISTDPTIIMHANPADCGEIAVSGLSAATGKNVIGLIHASRRIVDEGGHLRALEYLCNTHDVAPETLSVRLSPSARVDSYKFSDIDERQRASERWSDYVYQDKAGDWHVDFHGRTVDDLLTFGVSNNNLAASPIDTITDPAYFSHYALMPGQAVDGANGLFFALRGQPVM